MNRTIPAVIVMIACALTAYSQKAENRDRGQANNNPAATNAGQDLEIASGTHLAGKLQSTLDVRRAQVGDQVVLKTTKAIKSGGSTVVPKGARLIGHISEVTQKTKSNGGSSIGLVFDRLENDSLAFPISATISSITGVRANAPSGDDDLFADTSISSSSSARTSSGSRGGLVGGITSTAGAVVNATKAATGTVVGATTSAVGSAVNATTNAVVGTSSGAGQLGRIQIGEASSSSAEGGAVLSLRGENLRVEKGTSFNLVLNQAISASTGRDQ